MNDIALKIENLSKKYKLGTIGYGSFRRDLSAWLTRLRRGNKEDENIDRDKQIRSSGDFWALQNISVEVAQGERLGIIGRNGAGKSTLLKIISQITRPTSGVVKVRGRVASLLEVGTGFHPELTGRENVFLNGALLGMRRLEIQKKFDQIVDFAGVGDFIDTPVKRYSSGMYVRLGFSVAAHLETDILLVDEVLAVGDTEFQRKCVEKMQSLNRELGRTILFVSHNMGVISNMCSKGLLLDKGKLLGFGPVADQIQRYLESSATHTAFTKFIKDTAKVSIFEVAVRDREMRIRKEFSLGADFFISMKVFIPEAYVRNIIFAIQVESSDGLPICNILDSDSHPHPPLRNGDCEVLVRISDIRLYPDVYYVSFWVGDFDGSPYDKKIRAAEFTITDGGKLTSRRLPRDAGRFFFTPEWTFSHTDNS